jgi:hypothetical protein
VAECSFCRVSEVFRPPPFRADGGLAIRSVIPGMLRLSSLVPIGPSSRRHKIVPFHRPSMTDSIESIGQGETSFLDTDMHFHFRLYTDELVSTNG